MVLHDGAGVADRGDRSTNRMAKVHTDLTLDLGDYHLTVLGIKGGKRGSVVWRIKQIRKIP